MQVLLGCLWLLPLSEVGILVEHLLVLPLIAHVLWPRLLLVPLPVRGLLILLLLQSYPLHLVNLPHLSLSLVRGAMDILLVALLGVGRIDRRDAGNLALWRLLSVHLLSMPLLSASFVLIGDLRRRLSLLHAFPLMALGFGLCFHLPLLLILVVQLEAPWADQAVLRWL